MQSTIREEKIKKGIIWNLLSYVFLGVFTLVSYVLITWKYGEDGLGAYSIVMSLFLIFGQLGVFGLQSAAMYYVPQQSDKKQLGQLLSSFLFVASIMGSVVGGIVYVGADWLGNCIFSSQSVAVGLKRLPMAIVFFSMNKTIASYINAQGKMVGFAILQSIRYFGIVASLGIILFLNGEYALIFYAFILSELLVFLVGILCITRTTKIEFPKVYWMKHGVRFGKSAMLGNVVSDINTKVDVIMLGALCGDKEVGLYSFITIIVEGLLSILYVFRNNYNPLFSTLIYQRKIDEVKEVFIKLRKKLWLLFGIFSILILVGYNFFCKMFLQEEYMRSVLPAFIISVGCGVMAPYFVAGNLCTLKGKPAIDSLITLCTIVCNCILNYILISKYQIVGAAVATGLSYVFNSFLTGWMIRVKVWRSI